MQEIKKRRIVLASVLKPANDPRMHDRIGQSLAKEYDVHCIGQGHQLKDTDENPHLHFLPPFGRISVLRLFAPFLVLRQVIRLKPYIFFICTHELIFIASLAKLFTGCKVVYDVQENYYRNILYGNSFFTFLKPLIAGYVRLKEYISRVFVDHYFLAEKGYEHEMTFPGEKKTVLENKLKKYDLPTIAKASTLDGKIHLLFSGTLAKTTGVYIAVDLTRKLHDIEDRIQLTIIGYSADQKGLQQLRKEIEIDSFIKLVGGDSFVSHNDIVLAIQTSDFGIISYPPNPSTKNAIPTKLYEYLGYQLPILLIDNPVWQKLCGPYNAAITFSQEKIAAADIVRAMQTLPFFTDFPKDVLWSSEEQKLLQTIETII